MKAMARRLLAYLEGEVTQSEAAEIEQQLAGSASARQQLDDLRAMLQSLRARASGLKQLDLVPAVRAAIARSAADARRPRIGWRILLAAAVACSLAALVIPLTWRRQRAPDEEFRAKLASGAIAEQDRWAGLQIFQVDAKGTPHRLANRLTQQANLLFAYNNLGPRPFGYLMIFAIDEHGVVYWCYPAYERREANPSSLAIQQRATNIELPDLVRHRFPSGHLTFYGLFTRQALQVQQLEQIVSRLVQAGRWSAAVPSRLPLDDSAQHITSVWVQ